MPKETNLNGVKSVARMLLMTPVHKTPYSPAVVQHPFASSGIVGTTNEGTLSVVDITESEENLNQWQERLKEKINSAETLWEIYAFINKPYCLTFLKFAEPHLSKKDFSKILANAWVRSENPNEDPNFTKKELISLFERAEKKSLMTEDELRQYNELEENVTVYRGIKTYNAKGIVKSLESLSWTLDKKTAEWFARRFDGQGIVCEAEIDKKYIFALFNRRNESEVIIEAKRIQNLTVIEEIEKTIIQTM